MEDMQFALVVAFQNWPHPEFRRLEATCLPKAIEEVRAFLQGDLDEQRVNGFYSSRILDSRDERKQVRYAHLVQVEDDLPLDEWYQECLEALRTYQAEKLEWEERAELARLKAKYPDSE